MFDNEPSTAQMEEFDAEKRFIKWRRPAPPALDTNKDKLIFQQIDIDHYIGKPYPGMPGARSGVVPIMRMFGVTKAVSIYYLVYYFYLHSRAVVRSSSLPIVIDCLFLSSFLKHQIPD